MKEVGGRVRVERRVRERGKEGWGRVEGRVFGAGGRGASIPIPTPLLPLKPYTLKNRIYFF